MARAPILLGLTGSIGMGKSTVAGFFRELAIPVHDSDQTVKHLYAAGGRAVPLLDDAFPCVVGPDGAIDRSRLAARLRADDGAWKTLETIIHPLVAEARLAFTREARAMGADLLVCDIPLLFEIAAERSVDYVLLVTAPSELQRERVLARPGMTQEKFEALLARQMPDAEKRRLADFILETDQGMDTARRTAQDLVRWLRLAPPHKRAERRQ